MDHSGSKNWQFFQQILSKYILTTGSFFVFVLYILVPN
ncbi:uncharacterized protein METZ01_LOCUS246669 [marine metagenome]|uniref:Uncharacterized protein n=1 Tax=marine metagenome TaxID=408172 RepID=A0A382I341_9ZZZZ